jgi:hypothetical protein
VNPKVLEQSAGGGFYPKLAYYLWRKKMHSHHIIIPPLQIFTFASLKDLLLRIYDCITHGSDQNLGLQPLEAETLHAKKQKKVKEAIPPKID